MADIQRAGIVLTEHADRTAPDRILDTGIVTLVGGGPGDPGLVTVAGREAIENADVIVTDRLAPLAALAWARPDAEIIDVAKIPGGRSTSQDEINQLLVEHAKSGKNVVRFKGGDNFVFGRGSEELLACLHAGIEARVVPGVSSAIAAPALAGIPGHAPRPDAGLHGDLRPRAAGPPRVDARLRRARRLRHDDRRADGRTHAQRDLRRPRSTAASTPRPRPP